METGSFREQGTQKQRNSPGPTLSKCCNLENSEDGQRSFGRRHFHARKLLFIAKSRQEGAQCLEATLREYQQLRGFRWENVPEKKSMLHWFSTELMKHCPVQYGLQENECSPIFFAFNPSWLLMFGKFRFAANRAWSHWPKVETRMCCRDWEARVALTGRLHSCTQTCRAQLQARPLH